MLDNHQDAHLVTAALPAQREAAVISQLASACGDVFTMSVHAEVLR